MNTLIDSIISIFTVPFSIERTMLLLVVNFIIFFLIRWRIFNINVSAETKQRELEVLIEREKQMKETLKQRYSKMEEDPFEIPYKIKHLEHEEFLYKKIRIIIKISFIVNELLFGFLLIHLGAGLAKIAAFMATFFGAMFFVIGIQIILYTIGIRSEFFGNTVYNKLEFKITRQS